MALQHVSRLRNEGTMLYLTVENVRTIVRRQTVPIAPLTILTGENSSGKSTLLALLATVLDPEGFPFRPAFNKAPYSLGGYDTIATYKGGKFGRAKWFQIGYRDTEPRRGRAAGVETTYSEIEGQAQLKRVCVRGQGDSEMVLELTREGRVRSTTVTGTIKLRRGEHEEERAFSLPLSSIEAQAPELSDLILRIVWSSNVHQPTESDISFLNAASQIARQFAPGRASSLAPIRTQPERVYAQPTDIFEPAGNHIPFVLDRLLRDQESKDTQLVLRALLKYGHEAGLFEGVKVRKLGHKVGDPFQIMVDVGGRMRNLIDVGYGVSQALPVVVQAALVASGEYLLIQQPEVHLHPRAQAALGSLFSSFVKSRRRRLVIETHSDHIIDRVRQEVAAESIDPESVSLLFFERDGMETTIHALKLDKMGNVVNAPPSYRSFFLEEQLRLFTRTES